MDTLVYHYDAFSNIPGKGNPAGVVLNADHLTETDMLEIAGKVGFNETAFVVSSDKAAFRMRYFTPGHEMPLCGHATIASLYCMKSKGLLNGKESLTIETGAGILPINIFGDGSDTNVLMRHASPQFKEFKGSLEELSDAIGIGKEDIEPSIPVIYGSTGTWTLLVPVRSLNVITGMKSKNKLFPSILQEIPHASVHPFCLETFKPQCHMHGRHFSSPFSGTTEDPVTGTASGVMGAYYATFIEPSITDKALIVEQGQEMGKDGEVSVHIKKSSSAVDISISGTAVYVKDIAL
ncbi:MAG: yddE [Eubacterium sp.]|jgi:PhzF family phenazine biosynthesis protein|nr:yddE [Eubacterium sp.]